MNLRDLQAFLAVVETGSIVGASARLHLTQPGISRRIQALESGLDTVLLDRESKPLRPTAAGRRAYRQGRRMLRVFEDMKAELAPGGPLRGELRIGVTPYVSELTLLEPVQQLRATFPELTLQVSMGWPLQLMEQLRRGAIDTAAFCLPVGDGPPPEFAQQAVGVQVLHVVSPRQPPGAQVQTLATLSQQSWILNPDGCGFRLALQRCFEAQRLPFRVGIEALSSTLRLSLVARGMGLTLATRAAFDASPERDQLQLVPLTDLEARIQAWVLHRPPAGILAAPIACFGEALAPAFAVPT